MTKNATVSFDFNRLDIKIGIPESTPGKKTRKINKRKTFAKHDYPLKPKKQFRFFGFKDKI